MNTLVIYDSTFGNTEQIARSLAGALGKHSSVRLFPVTEAATLDLTGVDLLLLGCPTKRHGLSPAMRTFLERFPRGTLQGLKVATFDTRYHMSAWKSGSAAPGIARKLKRAGATLVMPAESFFVTAREGPLESGELERAGRWAEKVLEQIAVSSNRC
jgi:flavodoxin I